MGSQFDDAGETYKASAAMPFREHIEHHSIRTLTGDLTGMAALDLGCGTGLYTRRLAGWGAARVIGTDVSEGMLTAARTREETQPLGITYLHRDLTDADQSGPGVTEPVDLALAVYVLCYAATFPDLLAMFRSARHALRPGGRLLAPTMNPDYADERDHPGYYEPYGFALTSRAGGEPVDGMAVTLAVQAFEDTPPIEVDAAWWSYDAYQQALHEAGFTAVIWHTMDVSSQGVREYGSAHWAAYLARPHALVLDAR